MCVCRKRVCRKRVRRERERKREVVVRADRETDSESLIIKTTQQKDVTHWIISIEPQAKVSQAGEQLALHHPTYEEDGESGVCKRRTPPPIVQYILHCSITYWLYSFAIPNINIFIPTRN